MLTIHPVESAILELMSTRGKLSTDSVHKEVTSTYHIDISKQQLYRIVSKMADNKMLVKNYGSLTLDVSRIKKLQNLSNHISSNYGDDGLELLPTEDGASTTFSTNTFNDLANQLASIISMQCKKGLKDDVFMFTKHAYLPLSEHTAYRDLMAGFTGGKFSMYAGIASESVLDKYAQKLPRPANSHMWIDTYLPLGRENDLLVSLNDYVITVSLPSSIANYFAQFFENVQHIEQFDTGLFKNIFSMKADFSITIVKDPKSAKATRNMLSESYNGGVFL